MSEPAFWQLFAVGATLALLTPVLGRYLAAVFGPGPAPRDGLFAPVERFIFRLLGVNPSIGQTWTAYARSVVDEFTAAAVGMAVALAAIRGIPRQRRGPADPEAALLGNFWADVVRSIVRVLIPIAAVARLVLVSQGTVQNLRGNTAVSTVEGASR